MSALVRRLRGEAVHDLGGYDELFSLAADRIEALQRELAAANAALRECMSLWFSDAAPEETKYAEQFRTWRAQHDK